MKSVSRSSLERKQWWVLWSLKVPVAKAEGRYSRKFGQDKELHPQSSASRSIGMFWVGTERTSHWICHENMDGVGQDTDKANSTKDRESQVPQGHGTAPIPRTAILEISLTQNNAYPVENDSDNWNHWRVHHPVQNACWLIVDFKAFQQNASKELVRDVLQDTITTRACDPNARLKLPILLFRSGIDMNLLEIKTLHERV